MTFATTPPRALPARRSSIALLVTLTLLFTSLIPVATATAAPESPAEESTTDVQVDPSDIELTAAPDVSPQIDEAAPEGASEETPSGIETVDPADTSTEADIGPTTLDSAPNASGHHDGDDPAATSALPPAGEPLAIVNLPAEGATVDPTQGLTVTGVRTSSQGETPHRASLMLLLPNGQVVFREASGVGNNWQVPFPASAFPVDGRYVLTGTITTTGSNGEIVEDVQPRVFLTSTTGITSQPEDVTVRAGEAATFRLSHRGAPIRIDWYNSVTSLVGTGLEAQYTTGPLEAGADGHRYWATVHYLGGTVNMSKEAEVRVVGAPRITAHPQDVAAAQGQTVRFSASAAPPEGAGTISVQWQRSTDGATWQNATGATATSWTFTTAAGASENGVQYRALVTQTFGTVTNQTESGAATLQVLTDAPQITTQPQDQVIAPGTSATFTVGASGSGDLKVSWFYAKEGDWDWVLGANDWTLRTSEMDAEADGWMYRALVSNGAGSVFSEPATLRVGDAPQITTEPADTIVTVGDTAVFEVAATGTGPIDVRWQWSNTNGTTWGETNGPLPEAWTFETPERGTQHDGYRYRAIVTSPFGEATSRAATLRVIAPVEITNPVEGQRILARPLVSGTHTPGAHVDVTATHSGETTELGRAQTGPDGVWTLTTDTLLDAGDHQLTATGAHGPSHTVGITVHVPAPVDLTLTAQVRRVHTLP